jgi:hypothetical protein
MNYLYPKKFYEDQYDLHTIEECLDWYWRLRNGMEKHRGELKGKEPEIDFDHETHKCCSITVNVIKGERYRHRAEKIKEWMDKDQQRQDKYDNTPPPSNIVCDKCYSPTKVISKTLHYGLDDDPRMSFMFECLKCEKRQIFYEDGSEWDFEPEKCKECDVELETKYRRNKKKETLTVTDYCPKCSFKRVDVMDHKKDREEREKKDAKNKALLQRYRKEFCLDDKRGPQYLESMDGISRLVDSWKKQEVKNKDPVYQKAMKLKKLKLNQLKEFIAKVIKDKDYDSFEFSKPDMSRYVTVEFTANDTNNKREEYDSRINLQRIIKKSLRNTNWRLMSDGVSYRLGILSGRLKAYEKEEDLVKIVNK